MARGEFRRGKELSDPNLPLIRLSTDHRKTPAYYAELRALLAMLWEHRATAINYHHVTTTIPRTPLTHYYKRIHHDITYISSSGDVVFILVNVLPRDQARQDPDALLILEGQRLTKWDENPTWE